MFSARAVFPGTPGPPFPNQGFENGICTLNQLSFLLAFSLSAPVAPEPPPGYRAWNADERARLAELLAEVDAVTAHRKPGKATKAGASAKDDDPYGWGAIIARVSDPRRWHHVVKDGRP